MKIGDRVFHPSYGKGKVIALMRQGEIMVKFDNGSEVVVKEKDCVRRK